MTISRPPPYPEPGADLGDPWLAGTLVEGERVLARGRIHTGIFWKGAALAVLGALVWIAFAPELGAILLVLAGLVLLGANFLRGYLRFVLTNRRVLARSGVIVSQNIALALDRVESIEIERMLPGVLMGYYDVVVTGTGSRAVRIPFIANAPAIRRAHDEARYGAQDKAD